MKKCLVLGILTFLSVFAVSCKKSEEDTVVDSPQDYVSIINLQTPTVGTSLTETPQVTWQLGFPLFYTLEMGLGSSATTTPDVAPWTDLGVVTSARLTNLSLSECVDYYPMVRAKNNGNGVLDSHVVTTPFQVDLTNPTTPSSLVVTSNATESASALVSWTASTDNCVLAGYNYAIGTTSGAQDVMSWSPIITNSHRATTGLTLDYGREYFTSVRARDGRDRLSAVATTPAWRLRSPAAILVGTQSLASNDFNQGASFVRWASATLDDEFFSHSLVTNPETLQVKVSGDYLIRLNMPFTMTSGCATRCAVRAMVAVNGVLRDDAVANSSYVINAVGFSDTSNQLVAYLRGLSANDEIKIYVDRSFAATGSIVSEGIQAYVEYIYSDRSFFYGNATQTLSSTNLNLSVANLSFTQTHSSSDFTFASGTPDSIRLNVSGNHWVAVNFPFEAIGACTTRNNVKLQVTLNNVQVNTGQANQGGIDCQAGHVTGSAHWVGLIPATAGDVLRVRVVAEASNSVVQVETGKRGSVIVERLNSIENYLSLTGTRTVASTDWNGATASPIQWSTQVATDPSTYTHSTVSNSHNITITQAGRYVVMFSDHLTSATVRVNVRIRLQKNGIDVTSGVCASNIITNSNANNEGSCAMSFLLSGVGAGDVLTVTAIRDAAAGVTTALSPASLTLLRVR